MKTCSEPDCAARHYGRGLCKRHYTQLWSRGAHVDHPRSMVATGATLDERLRHHGWTVTDSGCWEWAASLNSHGYGQLAVGTDRPMIASRAAYEAWVGPIPSGEVVCHSCDNPPCINPRHLFLGDRDANNKDMSAKGRSANGERKKHHKLTDDEVDEIRGLYATGRFSQKALGERFGVSQQLVGLIASGRRRRERTHVALKN